MKKKKLILALFLFVLPAIGGLAVIAEKLYISKNLYVLADNHEYRTVERVYTDKDVQTSTTILEDTDKDGLLDVDDPNPEIPEVFVVEDYNQNGIVDSFEKDD